MKNLVESKTVRLFAVCEEPNENGFYPLESFESEELNKAFDHANLRYELYNVCRCLFGGGECYEIDETTHCDDGKIYIPIDDENKEEVVVNDITEKIDCTPDTARIFVAVSGERTKRRQWIVLESEKTIYSESD